MNVLHAVAPAESQAREPFTAFFDRARHLPVYVVLGVQGSGTNLLRSILARAFRFCVVQDQSIVFNAAAPLGDMAAPGAVRRQFDGIQSQLLPSAVRRKTMKIVKSNSDFTGIADHLDASRIESAAHLARFVYAYGAYRMGTTLMAVKSDDLWEHIDRIDTVIPNRRIILLTRDFRDNLLSITRKDFGPIEPWVAARYVHDRFARYEHEFNRAEEAHRLHVRYEDLLATPHDVVERVGRHFGLTLASGGRAALDRLSIRKNNTRKWGDLDARTLSGCEAILRDELIRFGYGVGDAAAPTPAAWALARGRDVLRRVPQKVAKLSKRLRK